VKNRLSDSLEKTGEIRSLGSLCGSRARSLNSPRAIQGPEKKIVGSYIQGPTWIDQNDDGGPNREETDFPRHK